MAKKRLPKIRKSQLRRGQEIRVPLRPPGTLLGGNMSTEITKGKVPAEESGELIVWDNRQQTA